MASAPHRGLQTTAKLSSADAGKGPSTQLSLLVSSRDGAEIVPLSPGASVVVGRAPPSEVIVADISLSRQHARFTFDGTALLVEDLGSSNGTRLHGVLIEKAEIHAGDTLALGAVTVAVQAAALDVRVGLTSQDHLREWLSSEIVRARLFGRTVGVLVVQSAAAKGEEGAHYRAFHARVTGALRPVDKVAVYSESTLIAGLPEIDEAGALAIGKAICEGATPRLRGGVSVYPRAAGSVDDLIASALAACRESGPKTHVAAARVRGEQTLSADPREAEPPVAESPGMRAVLETIRRVARGGLPVLLLGQTGSGKEVVARILHRESPRREGPLVAVNCGALPSTLVESTLFGHEKGAFTGADRQHRGVFESAEGGTVLLDEVGELPLSAQAALLRVLETKQIQRVGGSRPVTVDVRVVAATHRDLESMCGAGQFREDLLYRLDTVRVRVPPLSERPEDIGPLVERFLARAAAEGGPRAIDPEAVELLRAYAWPGNVRELRNAIERAAAIAPGDTIGVDDLPERVRLGAVRGAASERTAPNESGSLRVSDVEGDFRARMERLEAALISHALEENGHNQTATARRLGMPLRTLVHKMGVHGIRRPRAP